MDKHFLSKQQKKILSKNIGILFLLTIVCAILARCGSLGGKETLEDLAQKQKSTVVPAISPAVSANDAPTIVPAAEVSGNAVSANTSPAAKEPPQKEDSLEKDIPEEPLSENRTTYQEGFYYEPLNDIVKARISGISYPADDKNAAISYDMLRYVGVLYYDADGNSRNGELICHKEIAQDMVEIFYSLYQIRYPVEKIALVEEYQADDLLSMQDNNTSCFNYRALPSGKLSNHAYGLAIDLNPFYNPYVTYSKDGAVHISPPGSEPYADRTQDFPYKIDENDPAYQLFIQHGFFWGGHWRYSKDYQHFEKSIKGQ